MFRFALDPAQAVLIHTVFEILAYALGFQLWRKTRTPLNAASSHHPALNSIQMLWVLAGAILGAALGSKMAYWLEHPLHAFADFPDPVRLMEGKSIVGGLLGGLIGVELTKWQLAIKRSTGDTMVWPLVIGMSIGRLGCFFAGLNDKTYGLPSSLPWAIDFGDGLPRHPTQLYEIAFLLIWGAALTRLRARMPARFAREGDGFRLFLSGYLMFRLFAESIKPVPFAYFDSLSGIQLLCLAGLVYYARDVWRWFKGIA